MESDGARDVRFEGTRGLLQAELTSWGSTSLLCFESIALARGAGLTTGTRSARGVPLHPSHFRPRRQWACDLYSGDLRLYASMCVQDAFSQPKPQAARTSEDDSRTYNGLKVRFSETLGEKPEIELACVIVPLCTENGLRFSAHLGSGEPEVRFERIV
jgi:hypothetical protein